MTTIAILMALLVLACHESPTTDAGPLDDCKLRPVAVFHYPPASSPDTVYVCTSDNLTAGRAP